MFLRTISIVGLYPNISHSQVMASAQRFLKLRNNKQVSSGTLIGLAKTELKKNISEFDGKTFNQVRGATIGTKFAPPYTIFLWLTYRKKFSMLLRRNL